MNIKHSPLVNRDLRHDEPDQVGVSTLQQAYRAMERGDMAEAKRITEYARLEWQVVHDMYVNWSWSFFTYIADNFGEEALEKAYRSILGSYYRHRYDKVMASDVKTQLQLTVEGLRGHLMGKDRQGEISITEEEDRYVLKLDPCGSGGVARQRVESGKEPFPEHFGFSKKAHDWTWGKKNVCYYCGHCTFVNEILAIEQYGHPMRITEYPADLNDTLMCNVYVELRKQLPYNFAWVGKKAPEGAPR